MASVLNRMPTLLGIASFAVANRPGIPAWLVSSNFARAVLSVNEAMGMTFVRARMTLSVARVSNQ